MGTNLLKNRSDILVKKQKLEATRKQLKSEFFGLDGIIDELINIVSSWYIFPYIQEKPVVVNLWGLTGTGKTSLINRMIGLLEIENPHYKLDMSKENQQLDKLPDLIEELNESNPEAPFVITLDEFQHARTINEFGNEIQDSNSGIIWNLLDTGKVELSPDNFYFEELNELVTFYQKILNIGIVVRNGLVVKKATTYVRKCKQEELAHDKPHFIDLVDEETGKVTRVKILNFVHSKDIEMIYGICKHKFNFISELRDKLYALSGHETIAFIKEMLAYSLRPKLINATKSLIFVIGNLDEAYSMGGNYTPDISADEFYEQTKKIDITQIKDALKKRFRNEQIARLGNTHLIYPAFSEAAFNKLIEQQLRQISLKLRENFNLNLEFDKSIHHLIYSEGVFPTQGARPIITTVQQIISTRLSKLASEILLNNISVDKITFSYSNGLIYIKFYSDKELVHTFSEKQVLNLEKLRVSKKDDRQAITAVHESGHAVLTALLLKTIPENIISSSVDTGINGFVFSKIKWNYVSKKEVLARIAVYFGGFIAEEIVFGKDNVTMGSEQDIADATKFITTIFKSSGMGSRLASFRIKHDKNNYAVFDSGDEINNEALNWLDAGRKLAEKTIKANKVLLLNMSNYLSDHRQLNKKQIRQIVLKYAHGFSEDQLIENGNHLFYRAHLKSQVKSLGIETGKHELQTQSFSLNNHEKPAI